MQNVQIVPFKKTDSESLLPLILAFRAELCSLRQDAFRMNLEDARAELSTYLARKYPLFLAYTAERIVGYAVIKMDGNGLWLESLYVDQECRRLGITSKLYAEAEALAHSLGEPTIYNNVHPNNEAIIRFLKKRGCDVLNLIELRSSYSSEEEKTIIARDRLHTH